ncbi:MAG: 3-deoxy-7-phosphoheptulonate synthase, partial [Planctomycetota bacterium]|nr:3-deoxy-7-phosphoheptulonate synthase [Planctomycetota bacterium]
MIIVMRVDASEADIAGVVEAIEKEGGKAYLDRGAERVVIGVRTDRHDLSPDAFRLLHGVEDAIRVSKPYK